MFVLANVVCEQRVWIGSNVVGRAHPGLGLGTVGLWKKVKDVLLCYSMLDQDAPLQTGWHPGASLPFKII